MSDTSKKSKEFTRITKILSEEERVKRILSQFERKRETYLGDKTLSASKDTQQHNAAVCRNFLEYAARHFKKVSEIKHVKQDHYAHWIQVRRRDGKSDETLRKDSYVLQTFFEAAELGFRINPAARVRGRSVDQ